VSLEPDFIIRKVTKGGANRKMMTSKNLTESLTAHKTISNYNQKYPLIEIMEPNPILPRKFTSFFDEMKPQKCAVKSIKFI
jgi:hypothetical protein